MFTVNIYTVCTFKSDARIRVVAVKAVMQL